MGITWPLLVRRVHGHSMLPILPPGTLIFGLRWYLRLKTGQVAVVRVNAREVVKRIARIENDKLFLLGDHQDASTDSRQYGLVPKADVLALVIFPRTKQASAEDQASPDR